MEGGREGMVSLWGIWVRCAGVSIGDGVPDNFGEFSCVWRVIFGKLGSDTACARTGLIESRDTVKVFEDEGVTTG